MVELAIISSIHPAKAAGVGRDSKGNFMTRQSFSLFKLSISEVDMRLTWWPGCQSHLSHFIQFALILVTIQESWANCYTSEIRVPTLQNTKHVEVTINPDEQIVSLEESIKQLMEEINIEKS